MSDEKGSGAEAPEQAAVEPEDENRDDSSAAESEPEPGPDEAGGEATSGDESEEEPESDLGAQFDELNDRYLRLAADYDNFRRRTFRERQETQKYGNENLVKEMLASVDNLDRAVEHGRGNEYGEEAAQLLEGIELSFRSLMQALEKFEVSEVPALGQAFDPSVHEAIRQAPSAEHAEGLISEVHQKGYRLSDRLLRPALVTVSSGPAEEDGQEAEGA